MNISFETAVRMLDIRHVEFRVREFDNSEKWEDMKATLFIPIIDVTSANTVAQKIVASFPDVKEVRWNFAGSSQGHFIQSKKVKWEMLDGKRRSLR